jgi:hypothetical protein
MSTAAYGDFATDRDRLGLGTVTTYITKRGGTEPQTLSDVRNQVWFNLRKNRLSLFDELAPADIVYLFFDYGADSVLWKTRLITVTQFTYSSVEELAMRFTEQTRS